MKQRLLIVGCVGLLSGALVYGQTAGSPAAAACARHDGSSCGGTADHGRVCGRRGRAHQSVLRHLPQRKDEGRHRSQRRRRSQAHDRPARSRARREQPRRVGADRPEASRRHDAACRHAASRAGHLQVDDFVARERARPDRARPTCRRPGLHRLNRTEYANVIRDLLDLEIDPGKYLPSDDSTRGFDNIAGALGISSTLVEAYVSAAGKISRLAIGEAATPNLVVYRTPEDTSQDYHIEGLPFGTRGGMLVSHVFPSDGEYTVTVTPIFGDNMSPTGFGSVPCEKLEVLLDGQRLELLDWQGGGRFGVAPAACGGAGGRGGQRGRGAAAPAAGQQPPAAAGNSRQLPDNNLRQQPLRRRRANVAVVAPGRARKVRRPLAVQPPVAVAVAAGAAVPRCVSASRRRPDRTRSVSRSCKPTSRRSSTWISISCGTRCRPVRRPGSRSFRTSARSGSKGRTMPVRRKTRRAAARFSSAARPAPPTKRPARARSSRGSPRTRSDVRPLRPTSTR